MNEKSRPVVESIKISSILQSVSWRYAGCGYWIDPVTKGKHVTNVAFGIAVKRNPELLKEDDK